MNLWLRGRTGAELGAEPSSTGARDPIAIFAVDGIVEGTVPQLDERMTEALAGADRIQIRTTPAAGLSSDRVVLELDDVVAIAAPPRPPSPARVRRLQQAVEFFAGPYRVEGIAHLPPGADPGRYIASTPRKWLPLTDCTVATDSDAWAVDVVIVNTGHLSRREFVGLPSPPLA